ncbi:hypothetical protein Q7C36_010783 [Tachysurus vachellii]|uniref:Uncharacterized protein n=1 Tax=Tachysurus vachellii TaxID=175792 RepID=A0AA88SUE9_TACVA|nr:hypothetical protein Q7C36_010783 [Tachysurus vachellii]
MRCLLDQSLTFMRTETSPCHDHGFLHTLNPRQDRQTERNKQREKEERRGVAKVEVSGMTCSGCSHQATRQEPRRSVIGHWPCLGGA